MINEQPGYYRVVFFMGRAFLNFSQKRGEKHKVLINLIAAKKASWTNEIKR